MLLDISLPEMSGLEAFRAFHALDPKLPMIFVTAMDSSDVAIQAMTLGAYDFVMKPLDVTALRKLVGQAIEVRRLMNVPVSVPGTTPKDIAPTGWWAAAPPCRTSTKPSAAWRRKM